MLKMKEKQKIILLYQAGKSNTEISMLTSYSINTINKYLKEYEKSSKELGLVKDVLGSNYYDLPKYDISNRLKRKLTVDICTRIEFYLSENDQKRKNGRRKQQKTGLQIHECLISEGYIVGKSTVYSYIKEYKDKSKEAFIKQKYNPGEVCEFDWGEVKIFINGKLQKFNMAVFTSAFSNFRYAILVKRQDTQSFQYVHAKFFEYIKGSYKTIKYDNMKVAVKRFVGYKEKEATTGLLSIATYYGFNFVFCNVRKGNEKGHVEKSVGVIRTAAFGIKEKFNNLEEANKFLLKHVEILNQKPNKLRDNLSSNELFNNEKNFFNDEKPFFETAFISENRVDKFSTISVYQNNYSVPEEYVGKMLDLRIYPNEIVCYYRNKKIYSHIRFYTLGSWYINIEHYLKTLKRKPGALKGSVAFEQSDKVIKSIYNKYYIDSEKDFIELLNYMKTEDKSIEDIINSIEKLLMISNKQEITTDKIKMQISSNNNENLNDSVSDLSEYDSMFEGVSNAIH